MRNKNSNTISTESGSVEGQSTAWYDEVELTTRGMRSVARNVGLGQRRGAVKLSFRTLDRRRVQIWILTVIVLLLITVSMSLIGGDAVESLPDWLSDRHLIIGAFVLVVLYGFYVFEKENQLRKLTRFLVEEQFHKDVVNRRLKLVESFLDSSKAANLEINEQHALDIIGRHADQFFDDSSVAIYLTRDEGHLSVISGETDDALDELAINVIKRSKSLTIRPKDSHGRLNIGVPIKSREELLGTICLQSLRTDLDTFEVLMSLALFAELASSAIVNSRSSEKEKLEKTRREYESARNSSTGLLNRNGFIELLDSRIGDFGDEAPKVAVIFINVDHFNRINNSLGYEVGDAVIRQVATSFEGLLPHDSITGHFGGDEFIAALFEVSGYQETSDIAELIRGRISEAVPVGGHNLRITVSIGIAMPETFDADAGELVRNAHVAMQQVKQQGGDSVMRFDVNLLDDADRTLDLENDIRRALDNDEIIINLQPVFKLDSMQPVAVEALVRWSHPEHGILPASSFLPFAKKSGQLKEIDQRVFQKSCAAVRGLRDHGFQLPVHANLFPGYLKSTDLIAEIKHILDTAGISPSAFVIEISDTEHLLRNEQAADNLRRLKDMGFKIALDDFGSGSSGLESLNRSQIDIVKISRNFINHLGEGDATRIEMVRSIMSLATRLEIEVIAVGVENDLQVDILRELGCSRAQGYYLGKPLLLKPFLDRFGNNKEMARSSRLSGFNTDPAFPNKDDHPKDDIDLDVDMDIDRDNGYP
ncbi:MAG: hypothetical protein DHS20C01_25690 [marine bacterium B5-7]|nr:MAG: hypothetical protein DHS20C01_25690 [marine bacterium B5-7]